jgi:hypothetical protein
MFSLSALILEGTSRKRESNTIIIELSITNKSNNHKNMPADARRTFGRPEIQQP